MSVTLFPRVRTFIASSKSNMDSSFWSTPMLRKSESKESSRRSTTAASKRWSLIVRRKGLLRWPAAARSEMPFCFCQSRFSMKEALRNQLLDLLDHAPAFVADHKVDACDPCADQGI